MSGPDPQTDGAPILEARKVTRRFGGLVAVREVDFQVDQRQIVGLIGPNGAGKTTVFNVITGVYRPTAGRITFEGASIAGERCGRITRRGIARDGFLARFVRHHHLHARRALDRVEGLRGRRGIERRRDEALVKVDARLGRERSGRDQGEREGQDDAPENVCHASILYEPAPPGSQENHSVAVGVEARPDRRPRRGELVDVRAAPQAGPGHHPRAGDSHEDTSSELRGVREEPDAVSTPVPSNTRTD